MEQLIIFALLLDVGLFLALLTTIALFISDRKATPSEQPKPPSKPLFKPKEPKETEEQRKERILLENIESYDGTPKGQQKL